jgi:phosphoadenosine phosphosulfate reductase
MISLTESRAVQAQHFLRQNLEGAAGVCVTSSFQAEDVVLLHLVREILAGVPVLFLETGYHFPETLAYRDPLLRSGI